MRIWLKRPSGRSTWVASETMNAPLRVRRGVVDVAGVEVHSDVVTGLEEIEKAPGPQPRSSVRADGPRSSSRRMVERDRAEVVLEDPAQEDEEDGVVRDLLDEVGEEAHSVTCSSSSISEGERYAATGWA
jgi:hypothetical protein